MELFSETLIQHGSHDERVCDLNLIICWRHKTIQVPDTNSATYTTYWCAPTGSKEPTGGYLFGGAFTSNQINPATSAMSCPMYFEQFRMGVDGTVCASQNFDLAYKFAIPFAGFESCQSANPLAVAGNNSATTWLHTCPPGFSKYLMMVQSSCEISYCVKSGFSKMKNLPPARLPPFSKLMHNVIYMDMPMVLMGRNGKVWIKEEDNMWKVATAGQLQQVREVMSSTNPNISNTTETPSGSGKVTNLSNGAVAAISVCTTFIFCTVIACVIFFGICQKKKQSRYRSV